MQESDFRPAKDFALKYGVKSVVYGGPGTGKSPICIETAPRPAVCMSEPGFLSLRKSNAPTWPAFTPEKFEEFVTWGTSSAEAKKYDTFIFDSVSQACETCVDKELGGKTAAGNEQHGLRAYGKMARIMMEHFFKLYFLPEKHIILICKLQNYEVNGAIYKRPYFPGKELPVRVPHLYDLVMMLGTYNIPGVPNAQKAFRCMEQFDMMARDRSGNLLEYEPPNMGHVIQKCLL